MSDQERATVEPCQSAMPAKASTNQKRTLRTAVLSWTEDDGIARLVHQGVSDLGHDPITFLPGDPIPTGAEVVITNGPYGKLLPVLKEFAQLSSSVRPITVHWNTEGLPDLRLPFPLMKAIALPRSFLGQLFPDRNHWFRELWEGSPLAWLEEQRMLRFRNLGDYLYAYHKGWLDILADSSNVYTQIYRQHGVPVVYMPWGSRRRDYANLNLERDIDVLWMGARGSRRRSKLLDQLREQLRASGVEMYVADNIENPFIFDDVRIEFLNRAKITLNLTRTWYDDNFSRFTFAMGNRSLVVSESMLPHCIEYEEGLHYVSAPAEYLAQTILHYLDNEAKRRRIVENAYRLITTTLACKRTVARIMDVVFERCDQNHPGTV